MAPRPRDSADRPSPREEALDEIVAWVQADAEEDPAVYLEETLVPEGGE